MKFLKAEEPHEEDQFLILFRKKRKKNINAFVSVKEFKDDQYLDNGY